MIINYVFMKCCVNKLGLLHGGTSSRARYHINLIDNQNI